MYATYIRLYYEPTAGFSIHKTKKAAYEQALEELCAILSKKSHEFKEMVKQLNEEDSCYIEDRFYIGISKIEYGECIEV